jgi:hypothetical protein
MTFRVTIKNANATLIILTFTAYVECCYAECHFLLSVTIKSIMMSIVMLNVDMLNVMAPPKHHKRTFWKMKIILQQNDIFSLPSFQSWYHENINKRSNQY